jgi:hypothetical protein
MMPRGRRLTSQEKIDVHRYTIAEPMEATWIYEHVFSSDPTRVSLEYICRLQERFRSGNATDTANYLVGSDKYGGRPKLFDSADYYLLDMLIKMHNKYRLYMIREEMMRLGQFPDVFSIASLHLAIEHIKVSTKRFTRIHFLQDDGQGLAYLKAMEHVHPRCMATFDETSTARNGKFKQSTGRSRIGEPAVSREWVVGGRSFSIIALMTYDGVAEYLVKEGTIDHVLVEQFMRTCVAKFAGNGMHFICDNASIHVAPTTLALFDQVTQGHYLALPCTART